MLVSIDDILGVFHITAETDRKFRRNRAGRGPGHRNCPRHGENPLALLKLGHLGENFIGSPKGLMHHPAGAGSAIFAKLHAPG